MTNQSHVSSQLGSNDLEEDYPHNLRIANGSSNLTHAYTQQHQLVTAREGYSVQSRFINNNFGSNEDIAPQPHPYEGYKHERKRLETFRQWPPNAPVKSTDLARNGFISLQIMDRVQCVFCRAILSKWEQGDVIEEEHKKHCPECPFASGYECGNIPINHTRTEQMRDSAVQLPNSRIPHTQTLSQHGNFSCTAPQPDSQSNFFSQQKSSNPSVSNSVSNPNAHWPQQTRQTINVQAESNAQISFNRNSGTLNIYSGNVTIGAGNQEDAIGSMPSLPSLARPTSQTANNMETIITSPKYPKWENEEMRLKSFQGWPAQMSQKAQDLVKAGLLYMGSGDRVKCYWCGGELYDWEPQDEPMEEHAKWFTKCGYVRNIMGNDYIQKVKDKQNGLIDDVPQPPDDVFSHPHVLAVLQHGYTREQIQSAFDHYGKEKLLNAQALLTAIDLDQAQHHGAQSTGKFSSSTQNCGETQKASTQAMDEDVVPHWLATKSKNLYSPGEDEIIVIDDVEMEDMEYEPDQSASIIKDTPTKSDETKHEEEAEKQSVEFPKNHTEATKTKGNMSERESKEDTDPVQLENERLKDQRLCKICLDQELAITFLPCGHLATCEDCSKSLRECPICRKPITNTVKIFWS